MKDLFLQKTDFTFHACPHEVDKKVLGNLRFVKKSGLFSRAKVLIASGVMVSMMCVFAYVFFVTPPVSETPQLTADDEQLINEVAQLFAQSLAEVDQGN